MNRIIFALFALGTISCGAGTKASSAALEGAPPAVAGADESSHRAVTMDPVAPVSATSRAPIPPPPAVVDIPPRPATIALSRASRGAADPHLDLGDAAFEKDDFAGAQKEYEAARKADEKHPGGETGLARTAIAFLDLPTDYAVAKGNKKLQVVAAKLDVICKKFEDFGPAWVEAGRAKLLLGDAAGALAALREGYRLLPNEPEAASALGVALLATGDAAGAEKYLARARDLDPGSSARHGNLGTLYFLLGRVPDAISEYDASARIAPNDAKAHADLGTALLASGDFRRAELELGKAIAQEPKRASFKNNLGYAFQSQGKLAAARAEYDAALAIDPKLASAWINLATLLAKSPATRGDARKALLKAQALDATDPRVKANLEELDALEKGHATP